MNKRTVMASLNKIANQLDIEGLHIEADTVTKVMSRLAYDFDERNDYYDRMDEHMHDDHDEYDDYDDYDEEYEYDEDDYDMGPEKEPFDYDSPEDEGDMYGDDRHGYMDKDTHF